MRVKKYFHNIQCDVCGDLANEEMWHEDTKTVAEVANESGWYYDPVDDKHYCPDCYEYGDDGEILVKDGMVNAMEIILLGKRLEDYPEQNITNEGLSTQHTVMASESITLRHSRAG